MFLGDFQLGDRIPLKAFCSSGIGQPVSPDEAPVACVYAAGDTTPVVAFVLPPADTANAPGLFLRALHLDARFAAGVYGVQVSWAVSGSPRAEMRHFTVLPGGHADGAVVALYPYRRPHADFLVQQTDGRKLLKGRNPTV